MVRTSDTALLAESLPAMPLEIIGVQHIQGSVVSLTLRSGKIDLRFTARIEEVFEARVPAKRGR